MKIKQGVSLQGLKLPMREVLAHADKIWKNHNQELVITSGTETYPHSSRSLHYYGYALDFRTRDFSEHEKKEVYLQLNERLHTFGSYRILLEEDHIHVEWRGAIENTNY